jgi:hypothetical protein
MAMSKRSGGEKQEDIWIAHTELAVPPGHPFYTRLNDLLEGARFDEFVEGLCARFYHARLGRPSLHPGVYFRALLVGYFQGIDGERGIAWRAADSMARSPNLNAHAERFVRTIKESCLERMILFGESAVRKATAEFMAHYDGERNHQGLDNALICPEPEHAGGEGEVHRRERLGGLLNYYYRKAA